MEARIKPTKIRIYVNSKRKTAAQVKAELGCDYLINGGLFLWSWKACPWLKVDGRTVSESADWNAWGYAWDDAGDFEMTHERDKANYISCVDLINPWDGPVKKPIYNADVGGKRGRTALGQLADGSLLLYCWPDGSAGARTPEALRDYFAAQGAKTALMLDGGGSCQGIFPDGQVKSSRIVHNFLCFWVKGSETNKVLKEEKTETMATLKRGSSGAAVKVLQSQLNTVGYKLSVDGDFGSATYNAVRDFQDNTALTVDGIVGPATLAMLDRLAAFKAGKNGLVREAAKYIGCKEPDGDDQFIRAYNQLAGTGFGMTTSWCQMFVVLCQKEAGLEPYIVASCTAARDYYKRKGLWGSTPEVGSLIYFDWDRSGDCDHVGIVAGIEGNTIYTIEGNSSGYSKDGVRVKSYAASDPKIAGYANLEPAQPGSGEEQTGPTKIPEEWAAEKAISKHLLDGINLSGTPTWKQICLVLDQLGLLE